MRREHSWQANVRDLYRAFQKADAENELIHFVDQSIITAREENAPPVEAVFTETLARFSQIHKLDVPGACYVFTGPELLLHEGSADVVTNWPARLDAAQLSERLTATEAGDTVVLARDGGPKELFDALGDAETVAFHPIFTRTGELLCVLAFMEVAQVEGAALHDWEVQAALARFGRQLHIAYEQWHRIEQESTTQELWELFRSLQPIEAFLDLAASVRHAFPTFGPLKIDEEHVPEVQIIVVPDVPEPKVLTIRGTTGSEAAGITHINVSDSIVGLLIEDPDLEYFYDDPRKPEYAHRYKSYLGNGREIKTEFALRLHASSGRLVGILNIESDLEDAFNLHHRRAIVEFSELIAPMVELFEQRLMHNSIMQRSVTSITSNYLDSLAHIFRHGIGTPLLAFKLRVEGAQKLVGEVLRAEAIDGGGDRLNDVIAQLEAIHKQIDGYTKNFANDISGFGEIGCFNLRELVEATADLAKRSVIAPEDRIFIEVAGEHDAPAFCGPLLKQHLYSLFTNAIYSLRQQSLTDAEPGEIQVTIEPATPDDPSQERELNERWAVRVRDNGGGASQEQLDQLREFRAKTSFRTESRGQGLGLLALQRYITSLGGLVALDSVEGEFFEVTLLIPKYRDDLHGPLSTTAERSVDGARQD